MLFTAFGSARVLSQDFKAHLEFLAGFSLLRTVSKSLLLYVGMDAAFIVSPSTQTIIYDYPLVFLPI